MAQCVNEACFPFLASWTVCFLILRLRQPRPVLRRLARQPGMAACSAAALVLVIPLLAIVIPEIYGALRAIDYKAALFQAFGLESRPPAPVSAYGLPLPTLPKVAKNGSQTQSPIAGPINPGLGEPTPPGPGPPAAPMASFPSLAMVRGPDLYEPHQPLWLWYSIRAINIKLIPSAHIASAIVGAWLTLLLAHCMRPERSWIDRFGTALGFAWIFISLGDRAVVLFIP